MFILSSEIFNFSANFSGSEVAALVTKKTFLRSQKALTEFGGKEVPEPKVYLEKPVEPEVLAEEIKKILT